ncbi:MAG: alginate lyase family protein [Pedobacter sp.]|uniref:alginate lyase family protein n=1 Tax=Pedobacter sp. TaxID=1411316 RepID=UPI0035663128
MVKFKIEKWLMFETVIFIVIILMVAGEQLPIDTPINVTPTPTPTPTPTSTPAPSGNHPNIYLNTNEITNIKNKISLGQQPWKGAYDKFMSEDVPSALGTTIQSVTYGGKTPPSGDIHDYFSEPPYISDGVFDPNADRTDYNSAMVIGKAVRDLGLAYALTGDNKYADKAIQLINAWTVNPATKMNPKVTTFNSQAYIEIPITITGMYYGADLIWNYQGWNINDKNAFKTWVGSTSTSRGRTKELNPQNYENWKILFISSSAVITGNSNDMDWSFQYWKELIPKQINTQGQIINELSRTRSLFYSIYSINAMTQTAEIARHQNMDLYNYKTGDGRGLELAYDYHAPYLAGKLTWPYQELRPDLLEYATYENAYSFKQKSSYMDVINRGVRPLYEKRTMGAVTLTHAHV